MNKGIALFNQFNGRLRVSVTHNCQLNCLFCHQEGIDDHWKPIYMDLMFFEKLIKSFKELQGKEINLTGGEPTLHPDINKIIEIASGTECKVALCTNGLRLNKVFDTIHKINQIKLSVHETDNFSGKHLLGKAYNFGAIETNILKALDLGANITINFTHTETNTTSFRSVIEKVIQWNTDLLVIDLITTRWNDDLESIGHIGAVQTEKILSEYATLVDKVEDRTGCVMKVFKSPTGKKWMMKDVNFGRLFTKMCDKCNSKSTCGEGVFVMRVDCHGNFKPCLLRKDLEQTINPNNVDFNDVKNHIINVSELMFPDDYYEFG